MILRLEAMAHTVPCGPRGPATAAMSNTISSSPRGSTTLSTQSKAKTTSQGQVAESPSRVPQLPGPETPVFGMPTGMMIPIQTTGAAATAVSLSMGISNPAPLPNLQVQ